MPKAKTTRKRAVKKDALTSELPKKEEVITGGNQYKFENCTGSITINHYNKKEETNTPVNKLEHWTNNPLDDRWLYLWNYNQNLIKINNEFIRTHDWELIEKQNHLLEAKRILLEYGTILDTTSKAELILQYYTGDIRGLKNLYNNYFQPSFYQFGPDEEEEIVEVTRSKRIRGKQPIYDDELFA